MPRRAFEGEPSHAAKSSEAQTSSNEARASHDLRSRKQKFGPNRRILALSLSVLVCSCQQQQPPQQGAAAPEALPRGVAEGRALLEQGQLDAALARLQEAPSDADNLYYQGLVWVRKAEAAPLPTPPPPSSPWPKGVPPPPAPEFKREEEEALRLFEQALALRPDHARTHLAMAELLAPHTLGRHQAEQAAQKVRAGRRGKPPAALPSPAADVDTEADRVIRAYRMATQGDPVWTEPLDGLIRFCMQMGRLAEADAAFQELIHRDKAKPEPLTRYGDFLLNERKDPQGAIARYREALMWRSDDEAAQRRLAEVFLSMGSEHYHKKEYAVAEARFREAQKYIKDPKSPEAIKLQAYLAELARIRQR